MLYLNSLHQHNLQYSISHLCCDTFPLHSFSVIPLTQVIKRLLLICNFPYLQNIITLSYVTCISISFYIHVFFQSFLTILLPLLTLPQPPLYWYFTDQNLLYFSSLNSLPRCPPPWDQIYLPPSRRHHLSKLYTPIARALCCGRDKMERLPSLLLFTLRSLSLSPSLTLQLFALFFCIYCLPFPFTHFSPSPLFSSPHPIILPVCLFVFPHFILPCYPLSRCVFLLLPLSHFFTFLPHL